MKNVVVSVIVPVFNVEKYIETCIQSILKQTFKDYEIIFIDDASRDNSLGILERYKKEYDNIKVFNNKNNMGVSYARNLGIEKAIGEYLLFIDSDDFINNICLETLINNVKDADIIISNYVRFYGKSGTSLKNELIDNDTLTLEELKNKFFYFYNKNIIHTPVSRLYKKEIIDRYNIRFNKKYSLGEDLIFNFQYLEKAKKIKFIDNYLYYYRWTNESLTNKYIDNYLEIKMELIDYIEKFLKSNLQKDCNMQKQINKEKCNVIIGAIQNLFTPACKLEMFRKKIKIKEILNNDQYIQLIKDVQFDNFMQKVMRRLIIKRNVKCIILFNIIKEFAKKVFKKRL